MRRPDPFDNPEFDWSGKKGREHQDEGIARVLGHEDELWKMLYRCVVIYYQEHPLEFREGFNGPLLIQFKGEDLHAYVRLLIGEPPHHSNSLGGMWHSVLAAGGIVEQVPLPSVKCKVNPKNHGCRRDRYRWARRGIKVELDI